MKGWIWLLMYASLFGDTLAVNILFKGEPALSLRTLQQGFNAVGHKFEIERFRAQEFNGRVSGKVIGNKVFNMNALLEVLKKDGIDIDKAKFSPMNLTLELTLPKEVSLFPLLQRDDGVELGRLNASQWFRVEGGTMIRIQPPYIGKWYPEIAVFDINFGLLTSYRSFESKGEWELELPSEAYFLKISNVQGMKMIKEGMWIESIGSRK